MNLLERKNILVELGSYIRSASPELDEIIARAERENPWFTENNIRLSLEAIATQFLDEDKLEKWIGRYRLDDNIGGKPVGLILAGNIPVVGWHDLMAVFITGHKAIIKPSSKDRVLIEHLVQKMIAIDDRVADYFQWVDQLKGYEAIISTGSNNSARYFKTYFGDVPHIIRRNRNSVAVLTGKESREELIELGGDIFSYFGMGCRNVSKLYVPQGYDFTAFLEVTHDAFKELVLHNKYKNNFDYNYAIFLVNKEKFLHNGCVMIKEDKALSSRIATLHYEYYDDLDQVTTLLAGEEENLQCIVSATKIPGLETLAYGEAQKPGLMDYADGVDTIQFLLQLN